jgi:hypothetical protein
MPNNTEEDDMPNREGLMPKFAVGTRVRLRKGASPPKYPHVPLEGWLGTVSQVSGTTYLVHWCEDTRHAVSHTCREQGERDAVDFRAMWLQERTLEAAPAILDG